jgi:ABC-type uncharacterized transport system substrate-binding protein
MRRRTLIAGLATIGLSRRALGQSSSVKRVGALMPFAQDDPTMKAVIPPFRAALARLGWIEGGNLRVDYRFASGDPALYKSFAAELVELSPDVILASTPPAVVAVRQQTSTIPIVFVLMIDPVGQGFVQSIAYPGGNTTGFSFDPALMAKNLQLLKEIAPSVTRVAVVYNPDTNTIANPFFYKAVEAAGPALGMTVVLAPVHDDAEIEQAVAAQAAEPGGAVIAVPDSFNVTHRDAIIGAAMRGRLPVVGPPPMVPAGVLLSYFFDVPDLYAQAASYVDRILKGVNPADLPVQEPTKYVLTINLKTAKALGLTVPQLLLTQADEVIE